MSLIRLHQTIVDAGIPISGISGGEGDVIVSFLAQATPQQQTDAAAIVSAFDWTQPAQDAWEDSLEPLLAAIKVQAPDAIVRMNEIIAAAPTAPLVDLRTMIVDMAIYERQIIQVIKRLTEKIWK